MFSNQISEALISHASSERVQELLHLYPKAVKEDDGFGWLPLHTALRLYASDDVITMIFKAYPEATQVQKDGGNLPLHFALVYKASNEVVNMILQAYPEAAQVKNNFFRKFPLHYACKSPLYLHDSSLEVLNLLITAYPEGMDAKDRDGKLPEDYLKEEAAKLNSTEHMYLQHEAVKRGLSGHLITLLLRAFPESCITKDNNGMVPLHYACASSAAHVFECMICFLDANKENLKVQDICGRTPSKLFTIASSIADKNGKLPLHHSAASCVTLTEKTLLLLFNSSPESIRTPDKYGMLPFHHACLNQALSLEVLMLFVSLFPEAVTGVGLNINDKNDAIRPSKRKK